jgi:FkbM family methyltransferase
MKSESFWKFFNEVARARLEHRAAAFEKVFAYLDASDRPVRIVETGCVRSAQYWPNDCGSTVMFCEYAKTHPGTVVYSIDRDSRAVDACRSLVGTVAQIRLGESLAGLRQLSDNRPADLAEGVDLLFLDSSDLAAGDGRFEASEPAIHHLKELLAALPLLSPTSLLTVNHSPAKLYGIVTQQGSIGLIEQPRVGGHGRHIAEYAAAVGAELKLADYLCGWSKLTPGGRDRQEALGATGYVTAVVTSSKQGSFACGIDDEFVGKSLRATGTYGLDELERIAPLIRSSDDALVVGAHVGTIAIGLASVCRNVVAIEANPRTYRLLQCSVILSGASNVRALHLAASDRQERVKFLANSHNSGGSKRMPITMSPMYNYDSPEVVDVPGDRLDNVLDGHEFGIIFMDIEGSEYFALRGMPKILDRARALVVEFIPHHLRNVSGVSPDEFLSAIPASFDSLVVPSLGIQVARAEFRSTLQSMFDTDRADAGLIFTKTQR